MTPDNSFSRKRSSAFTRRSFLTLTGAAAAVASLPKSIFAARSAAPPIAPRLAWIVGTPGEFDWQHVMARTEDDAIRDWISETIGGDGCEVAEQIADAGGLSAYLADGGDPPITPCDCEWCSRYRCCETERVIAWDQRPIGSVKSADWLRIGWGSICCRCSDECSADDSHAVGDEAVCEGCMRLEDWRIVNPDLAAELEAETKLMEGTSHGS